MSVTVLLVVVDLVTVYEVFASICAMPTARVMLPPAATDVSRAVVSERAIERELVLDEPFFLPAADPVLEYVGEPSGVT